MMPQGFKGYVSVSLRMDDVSYYFCLLYTFGQKINLPIINRQKL